MKKLLLMALALFAFVSVNAQRLDVPLSFERVKTGSTRPLPRNPIEVPEVSIEDSVLYFESSHPAYALYLVDSNDNVVYQTIVLEDQAQVVLPSTLSGIYELQLYTDGDYYFYGDIEL